MRSSTSRSRAISRLAKLSAVTVYCVALASSPALAASSAMSTAWRALALTFSSSPMARLSRISVCFWWAMTLAACSLRRRCWSCASRDGLLELDLRVGALVEVGRRLRREVRPPPSEHLEHALHPMPHGRRLTTPPLRRAPRSCCYAAAALPTDRHPRLAERVRQVPICRDRATAAPRVRPQRRARSARPRRRATVATASGTPWRQVTATYAARPGRRRAPRPPGWAARRTAARPGRPPRPWPRSRWRSASSQRPARWVRPTRQARARAEQPVLDPVGDRGADGQAHDAQVGDARAGSPGRRRAAARRRGCRPSPRSRRAPPPAGRAGT